MNPYTDIFAQKCLNFKCSPVLSSNPVQHHEVWGDTNLPLVLQEWKPFRDDSRQAYSSQMPQQDFWQSMFCTFSSSYCSMMPIPSSPLEIRNYLLQKFSLSYRNKSIHKAGNGLCPTAGNNGSQNSSTVGNPGRHWVILRKKVLASALDRPERMVKVAAENLGCIISFPWLCFKRTEKLLREKVKIQLTAECRKLVTHCRSLKSDRARRKSNPCGLHLKTGLNGQKVHEKTTTYREFLH